MVVVTEYDHTFDPDYNVYFAACAAFRAVRERLPESPEERYFNLGRLSNVVNTPEEWRFCLYLADSLSGGDTGTERIGGRLSVRASSAQPGILSIESSVLTEDEIWQALHPSPAMLAVGAQTQLPVEMLLRG